jgi:regulatory protein
MIIETVKPAKRGKDTLVCLDDGRIIRLPPEAALKAGLREGMEITEAELSRHLRAAMAEKTKQTAANMISARQLSEKELVSRLEKKGASASDAQSAADWLISLGAVDDTRYARSIISYYSQKSFSRRGVAAELYKRGIIKEMADAELGNMPGPDGALDRLLHARLKGAVPSREDAEKTVAFLARRGFSYDDIRAAMRRYLEENR